MIVGKNFKNLLPLRKYKLGTVAYAYNHSCLGGGAISQGKMLAKPYLKKQAGLRAWLKWKSTYLANTRLCVQILVFKNKISPLSNSKHQTQILKILTFSES
jgi:hypothetical protein